MAIVVDAVDEDGAITEWHFLWGGIYGLDDIDTELVQDDSHSYSRSGGTGATFIPKWSGWSLLEKQGFIGGTGYAAGDILTLSGGGTVNDGQVPKIIVQSVVGGMIQSFDWLDYGLYLVTATPPTTLTSMAEDGTGSDFEITAPVWTRGTLATTIADVNEDLTGNYKLDLEDVPAGLGSGPIRLVYFGNDDGEEINNAIANAGPGPVIIPAACGTTQPIELPEQNAGINATVAGVGPQVSGLYAFAYAPSNRRDSGDLDRPVLSRVLHKGDRNSAGGGFSDMTVEGHGIPQGFGYYGFLDEEVSAPAGYVGPLPSDTYKYPTSGNVVQIDGGRELRIDSVEILNASGTGNAMYSCGMDEIDPGKIYDLAHVGVITITNMAAITLGSLAGAKNPDFAIRVGDYCHDSIFRSIYAANGMKADIFQYNGNIYNQVHVNSGAGNSSTGADDFDWPAGAENSKLAGVADYGFYLVSHTSIAQFQCDIAILSCVRIVKSKAGQFNPAQISDVQLKCGSLPQALPEFVGVWLPEGATNVTVSGVAANGRCLIPAERRIRLDGVIDSSVTLCNNSAADIFRCPANDARYAAGRRYTQPMQALTTKALVAETIYAMPFPGTAQGIATKLAFGVTAVPAATGSCLAGIYDGRDGVPGRLLAQGGEEAIGATGTWSTTIPPTRIEAGALYFLAVRCTVANTVRATDTSAGLSATSIGATTLSVPFNTVTTTSVSATELPGTFGTPAYGADAAIPNVYLVF